MCGKGPEAAALTSLTSLTRYTLRAAAIYDPDPITVLTNLDTVLQHEYQGSDPRYRTALFGLMEPDADGFTVTLAGGGHPPALAIRGPGTVEAIQPVGGQLIGILPAARFTAVTTRLAPGQGLLLYTDGLTEARIRSGEMLGEDGLTAYLTGLSPTNADGLIAAVTDLLTDMGPGPSDDTALLALTVPAATATRLESR